MAVVTQAHRGVGHRDQVAMTAVDRAVREGVDIVDIVATRDTHRVVSFVAAVRERYPEVVISVDTRRRETARAVLEAGADILDGAGADRALAEVAAERGCAVVCRYPGRASRVPGVDVMRDVIDDLTAQATALTGLGVPKETILIDPTLDVGEDTRLELLRHSGDVVATGWPVLITLSTEDSLGAGVDDRGDGILAATAIAAWAGIRVFRVHQVRQTRRVLEMVASIAGTRPPARAARGLTPQVGHEETGVRGPATGGSA